MGIWNSLKSFFGFETVTVRAKDSKGKFIADDKLSLIHISEPTRP